MRRIWAPWRIEYIRSEKPKECILCQKPGEKRDRDNHVLFRGKLNFVILNLYPYNPGHLMVAPYGHLRELDDLTSDELLEHFDLVRKCVRALTEEYKPQGFNIGLNLGKAAGAGIDDHLHTHIVPRWVGDTNFMTVVGDVRAIPHALAATYDELSARMATL
jgi:ATP adenylyltransferase